VLLLGLGIIRTVRRRRREAAPETVGSAESKQTDADPASVEESNE
jgi:hypothetical protein